jgi:protein-tyrosine phosphatase
MTNRVDLHVHLLAGLDDGPVDPAEALQMCRMLTDEGVTHSVALAHQNRRYPQNTPEKIREATSSLREQLQAHSVLLQIFPTAEVEIRSDLEHRWDDGKFLSIADQSQFLLLEFPRDQILDLKPLFPELRKRKLRAVIAHAERTEELLYQPGLVEDWIREGCLIQVSTSAFIQPRDGKMEKALKDWCQRGIVHALGSDGHRPSFRPPVYAAALDRIKHWTDETTVDRIAGVYPLAILEGMPVLPPEPLPFKRSWFASVRHLLGW